MNKGENTVKKTQYSTNPNTKKYQDEYMRKPVRCEICNIEFSYSNTSHHKTTKKHLKNISMIKNKLLFL